jgi:hypothetical protein
MNPLTRKFEPLEWKQFNKEVDEVRLIRPNGEPVPDHWCVLTVGEEVVVKNNTFKVAYIGESSILLEPTGIVILGNEGK